MTKPIAAPREACPTCGHRLRASKVGDTVLAQALFQQRLDRRLTLSEAAAAAKVDMTTYYRAEAGRLPNVSTAIALADWLGKSLDHLFMGAGA